MRVMVVCQGTLGWCIYLLSQYPDIQKKAREEVLSQPSTPKTADGITFLDAVIREAMRLFPVAPFVMRCTTQSRTYTTKTNRSLTIPKGCFVCVWIYALHRHERFWFQPHAFMPDRWLTPPRDGSVSTDAPADNLEAFMPFAHGPRMCVGQVFGRASVHTVLGELLRECVFESTELLTYVHSKPMEMGFTVLPAHGVTVAVRSGASVREDL
jgi:cytochrome P450